MFIQLVRFIIIGTFNTLISYLTYYLFYSILNYNYLLSLVLAYIIGVLNSYIWNSKWTFQKNKLCCKRLSKFVLVYISTFIINLLVLVPTVEFLKFNALLSQGFALIVATIVSFLGHKHWSFKDDEEFRNYVYKE
jgi:putative flippase GtrA